VSLTAVRTARDGKVEKYTVAAQTTLRHVLARSVTVAHHAGHLVPLTASTWATCYGAMDLQDAKNQVVATFAIPSLKAWRWWYRRLGLRLVTVP
jgi:hypothetical protein